MSQDGQAFTLTGKRPNTAGIRTNKPTANMNRDLMVPSLSVGKIQVHQKPDLVGYNRRIISVKNIVRNSGQGLSDEQQPSHLNAIYLNQSNDRFRRPTEALR